MPDNDEQRRQMMQRAWENLQVQAANPKGRGVMGLGTAMDIDRDRMSQYAPQGWQMAIGPHGERIMVPAAQAPETQEARKADPSVADAKLKAAAQKVAQRVTPKKLSPEESEKEADKIQQDLNARDQRWAMEAPAANPVSMGHQYPVPEQTAEVKGSGWDDFAPNPSPDPWADEEEMKKYGR